MTSVFSAHIPWLALSEEEICRAFGRPAPKRPSFRRVANFDEDAITMAYAAASQIPCESVDKLVICSNTLPPESGSAYLLKALRLPMNTPVTVVTGSWKCGLEGLAIAAQLGKGTLFIATECLSRFTLSQPSVPFADAAVALTGIEISDYRTISSIFEPLTVDEDGRASIFDDLRFSSIAAAESVIPLLGNGPVGFSTFDERIASAVRKGLKTLEDPLPAFGFAGCVQPFLFVREEGLVRVAAYGKGAAAMTLHAGKVQRFSQKSSNISGFEKFREIRSFMKESDGMRATFSSQSMLARDQDVLLGLNGQVCRTCNKLFTIPQTVCSACGGEEGFALKPLSHSGTIFSFTHEHYIPSPIPPVTVVIVDLDGGGRVTVQATDCNPSEIEIGKRVRLVLRKYHAGGGLPNYYWKAVVE